MKYFLCLITICLLTVKVSGQNQYLELVNPEDEYYSAVFPLLYKNFSDRSVARVVAMPSFSAEYSFSVERKSGICLIICNYLNKSYWDTEDKDSVTVQMKSTLIDKELYNIISQLFNIVGKQTRKRITPLEEIKVDGIVYYISAAWKNGTSRMGKTHSPDKDTPMRRLTWISWKLYQFGMGKEKEPEDFRIKITALIAELSK
jgi:hypothetical protein